MIDVGQNIPHHVPCDCHRTILINCEIVTWFNQTILLSRRNMNFAAPPFVRFLINELLRAIPAKMKAVSRNNPNNLDRSLFTTTFEVFALRTPPKYCQPARKLFRSHLLSIPRMHVVAKPPATNETVLYLLSRYLVDDFTRNDVLIPGNLDNSCYNSPQGVAQKFTAIQSCDADLRSFTESITKEDITTWKLSLTYDHYSIEQVLRAILPTALPVPTSFESVGHIAHINLRDDHAPWKHVIGEVMLDKLAPRIRTVVNKTKNTGGPYRTFAMEVLAGEKELITNVKENNCTFSLDFEKVYWNSRLETEHRRIVDSLEANDIFVDAFCGVGPFAIPAGKQNKCKMIYANDLNPFSVHYLDRNIKRNKIPASKIETSCSCARECITKLVKRNIPVSRIVMNFPAGAPEFLDVFKGLYDEWQGPQPPMPTVHCYSFVKNKSDTAVARQRIREAMSVSNNYSMPDETIDIRFVRDVAPNKVQICTTFKVPTSVTYSKYIHDQPQKKQKLT